MNHDRELSFRDPLASDSCCLCIGELHRNTNHFDMVRDGEGSSYFRVGTKPPHWNVISWAERLFLKQNSRNRLNIFLVFSSVLTKLSYTVCLFLFSSAQNKQDWPLNTLLLINSLIDWPCTIYHFSPSPTASLRSRARISAAAKKKGGYFLPSFCFPINIFFFQSITEKLSLNSSSGEET